jgi:hypothetical protein
VRRAEQEAGLRQNRLSGCRCAFLDLGDAEVRHLHRAVLFADQVRRLDVAMDDPFAVRVDERLEQALRDGDRVLDRQRAAFGEQHDRPASLHVLHHQHGVLIVVDEFVEAGDVAVAQLGEDLRFFHEALAGRDFAASSSDMTLRTTSKSDGRTSVEARVRPT